MFTILLLAIFVVGSNSLVGNSCETEADCGVGECCQYLDFSVVISKRLDGFELVNPPKEVKKCANYKALDETCDVFEKLNGFCGCGPGLLCHMYQVPINSRMIIAPDPGNRWESKCAKAQK